MKSDRRLQRPVPIPSKFTGFRFPPEVILLAGALVPAVRPVVSRSEGLLAERGIDVDDVTLYRWVQRFTPLLIGTARPTRHEAGDRWIVD